MRQPKRICLENANMLNSWETLARIGFSSKTYETAGEPVEGIVAFSWQCKCKIYDNLIN
jgi:hypothetical protein